MKVDWGSDRGKMKFVYVGRNSGSLCRWIGVVIGLTKNFLVWEDILGH